MAGQLDGKIAVITGGCSGIGLGTVELFVAEGAKVLVGDVQDDEGQILETRFPGRLTYVHTDVTDEAALKAMFYRAVDVYGGIDILFNNAAAPGDTGSLEDMTAQGWDRTMSLVLRSVMLCMSYAIPIMRERGGGAIVNTASIAGTQVGWGPVAYSTAKAGVIHLTKVAAAQLSPMNIRVNSISPGLIATAGLGNTFGMTKAESAKMAAHIARNAHDLQPVPKSGMPEDVAKACLFLATDASAFVSGANLMVDGALTVGPRHAWDPNVESPLMSALGLSLDQMQQLR
jgi:NAD(P)-dependent dehydrogenase (short-subunit alcohol dehydrogenase family)